MTKFLSKDPKKAVNEIKDTLYDRLRVLNYCIKDAYKDEYGYVEEYDRAMEREIEFLSEVLDMIERSGYNDEP